MKRLIFLITVGFIVCSFFITGSLAIAAKPDPDYGGNPPSQYYVLEENLPFDALPGAAAYWGIHKNAGYRIEVPDNWNGDLVLYCHGFRGQVPYLYVSNPRVRNNLIEDGFAWAASSYSTNGYDINAGVKDTHALGKFFNGRIGKPNRVFVMGHSMGGHITAQLVDQHPNSYAGAMPMCAAYEVNNDGFYDYILSYSLLSQYLSGIDPVQYPSPKPGTAEFDVLRDEIVTNLGLPSSLNLNGEIFKSAIKYLSGGERPIYDAAFGIESQTRVGTALDRTSEPTRFVAPGNVMSNSDTYYELDEFLSDYEEGLNENIPRIEADPQGGHPNGLGNIPTLSGDLKIPVIGIHDTGIYVPFSLMQNYARKVDEQGKSHLLVTRIVRSVSHCGESSAEEWEAFTDLLGWIETGIKPASDDILDSEDVASEDFGCQFSRSQRSYDGTPGDWICDQ